MALPLFVKTVLKISLKLMRNKMEGSGIIVKNFKWWVLLTKIHFCLPPIFIAVAMSLEIG